MNCIEKKASESFSKQIDPDTSEFECFFHFNDEEIYIAGFKKGYELAMSNRSENDE